MSEPSPSLKLAGLRVVELAPNLTAPSIGMLMAEQGADVIKVELLPHGDLYRQAAGTGAGTLLRLVNRCKRSIAVDLSVPGGQQVLRRLAASADVFVTGYAPAAADAFGASWQELHALRPGLVYCAVSYFGQQGPLAWFPAHDLSLQAWAGTLGRGADGRPCTSGPPAGLIAGAMTALAGILMAVLHARTSGRGDYLDVALHDALLGWTTTKFAATLDGSATQEGAARPGFGHPMHEVYETADARWVAVSVPEPSLRVALLRGLGAPKLAEALERTPGDPAVLTSLRQFLLTEFKTRTLQTWSSWAIEQRQPVAPVLEYAEALDHTQVRARGLLGTDADGGRIVRSPLRFAQSPPRAGQVPGFGAHTEAVLGELGYAPTEAADLRARGIVAG